MSGTATLIASTVTLTGSLTTQIAQMQADILAAGNLDNATVDAIGTIEGDTALAILTAGSLEAAQESILEIVAPGSMMAGGLPVATLLTNFNQLLVASQNEPVAFTTLALLTRVQTNLDAI